MVSLSLSLSFSLRFYDCCCCCCIGIILGFQWVIKRGEKKPGASDRGQQQLHGGMSSRVPAASGSGPRINACERTNERTNECVRSVRGCQTEANSHVKYRSVTGRGRGRGGLFADCAYVVHRSIRSYARGAFGRDGSIDPSVG